MLQLVYMSIAASPSSVEQVLRLSEEAERNNRRVEITGVLLSHAGYFLQALEGPKVAVEDTFLRIIVDPRHHALHVLSRRILTTREFGPWAMCACETETDAQPVIDRVDRIIAHAPDTLRSRFAECFAPSRTRAARPEKLGLGQ